MKVTAYCVLVGVLVLLLQWPQATTHYDDVCQIPHMVELCWMLEQHRPEVIHYYEQHHRSDNREPEYKGKTKSKFMKIGQREKRDVSGAVAAGERAMVTSSNARNKVGREVKDGNGHFDGLRFLRFGRTGPGGFVRFRKRSQ